MTLSVLAAAGFFSSLDVRFAEAMRAIVDEQRGEVVLAAALASRQTREGHVCADLRAIAGTDVADAEGKPIADARFPALEAWRDAIRSSRLVGDADAYTPLVLDASDRLYLRRYFEHERRLAELLLSRAGPAQEPIDDELLEDGLDRLFPAVDRQRDAAALAVRQRLCVVSGGPGTGKTSTVVKVLALLAEQARARGRRLDVALVAPTGKAAARMQESIKRAKAALPCDDDIRSAIPEQAATIHRTLGPVGGSLARFRFGAESPLSADVVIVDESSMVDVALMRRLLEAVRPAARLVLLGDRNQLASVEAGAVLGDICRDAGVATAGLLDRHVVELTQSYRFRDDGGIGALAAAINRGDAAAALAVLDAGGEEVRLVEAPPGAALAEAVVAGFRPCLVAATPGAALAAFDRFRVLCAHRTGPAGVDALNAFVEAALEDAGLLRRSGVWYPRRPLMVTRNDYQSRLFNGDIGMILPGDAGALRAWFVAADGSSRELSPSRLPPHETVFAMTVHKSQGSELDEIAVVLPDARSRLLSRELLYTAVTRARRRVVLHGSRESVVRAIERRVARSSGLGDALWGARMGENSSTKR